MQIRRPLLWIAGAYVLGESLAVRELPRGLRLCAVLLLLLGAALLPWQENGGRSRAFQNNQMLWDRESKSLQKGPLLFFVLLCAVCTAGYVRAAGACDSFATPEAKAFFAKWEVRNEGEFDYSLYLKGLSVSSQKAYDQFRAGGILASGFPYFSALSALRERCGSLLGEIFTTRDAGIYRAVLLGDKSEMDEGIREMYQSQGIAHLLAVSGLHLNLIGMGFFRLLRKCRIGLRASGLLAACLIFSYGFFTGASGSAMRAVIMMLVQLAALLAGRSYDTLSALALSAVVLLFVHPYLFLTSGFQLSFGAILSLSLFAERLIHAVKAERQDAENGSGGGNESGNHNKMKSKNRRKAKSGREGTSTENSVQNSIENSIENSIGNSTKNSLEYSTEKSADNGKGIGMGRDRGRDRVYLSVSSAWISACAVQLFTLPLVLYHFFVFPPYGIVLNLMVIPLMSLVMVSGLLALLAGLCGFPLGIAAALGGAGHYLLSFYEALGTFTSRLPCSSVTVGQPTLLGIAGYYGWMALLYVLLFQKKVIFQRKAAPIRRCLLYFLLLICAAFVLLRKPQPTKLTVKAIDVGQGDGFLLRLRGYNILLDGGSSSEKELGKYTLKPFLLSQGIDHLDAVLISHADTDHVSGIRYLLEEAPQIKVDRLILPKAAAGSKSYDSLKKCYQEAHPDGEIRTLSEGDCCRTAEENGLAISCLYEGRAHKEDANMHSPALLLEYGNFSMLFTGDMNKGDEARMVKKINAALSKADASGISFQSPRSSGLTVLKAAHHGSKTSNSEAVLKLFRPRYVLISYAKNNSYGHPHEEVTERFARCGAELLKTGEKGEIILETDGTRLWISSMLE